MQNNHIFYNSKQACDFLGISRRTLSRIINTKKIQYSKPGGSYRFHESWLVAFQLEFQNFPLTQLQLEQIRNLGQ